MHATLRLLISACIAFSFYFAWAYYANSIVTSDKAILLKAALVQAIYSSGVTLVFTALLEYFYKLLNHKSYCLPLIVPILPYKQEQGKGCLTSRAIQAGLDKMEHTCNGTCVPGMLLTPLPAIIVQTVLVISVNLGFNTPNLWLTVLPSILFSMFYGYAYSITLTRKLTK